MTNEAPVLTLPWVEYWDTLDQIAIDKTTALNILNRALVAIWKDDGHSLLTRSNSSQFLHSHRVPLPNKNNQVTVSECRMLEFRFLNSDNVEVKKAWYLALGKIRNEETRGKMFFIEKDKLKIVPANPAWLAHYHYEVKQLYRVEMWRVHEILGWFDTYGKDYFKDLPIWHINWEMLRSNSTMIL